MSENIRKPMCKRCGRETEPDEIHLFQCGEKMRQAIEEGLKTKVTLCTNPPPESFWRDTNDIMPIASVNDVIEGTGSWLVTIEIPKSKLNASLPRPGEGIPILGDIYSLEIIQDKQSIIDIMERKNKINNIINKYRETMNTVYIIDEQLEHMIKTDIKKDE